MSPRSATAAIARTNQFDCHRRQVPVAEAQPSPPVTDKAATESYIAQDAVHVVPNAMTRLNRRDQSEDPSLNKIVGAVHSDQVTIPAATAELARAFFSMRRPGPSCCSRVATSSQHGQSEGQG